MKMMLSLAMLMALATHALGQSSVLNSWNEGSAKSAILDFVERTTNEGSSDYVPPAERIAVFDNDGTLWSEKPMYVQGFFALDRIKALAPQHPEWQTKEPFASILKGDLKAISSASEKEIAEVIMAAHAGMTTDEFNSIVQDWIASAKHPKTGRLFTQMVFQPMLELLEYLRDHDFQTYIVSGGGVDFMRPWSQQVYGIPPEQVIGSMGGLAFEIRDGEPVLVKLPSIAHLDDNVGKPIGIQRHIGRRPIAAFGNSDGDLQMMQWTAASSGSLCLYVHHTDSEREWAYDKDSSVGRLDQGLKEAQSKGWTVVNMRDDWKVIYPEAK